MRLVLLTKQLGERPSFAINPKKIESVLDLVKGGSRVVIGKANGSSTYEDVREDYNEVIRRINDALQSPQQSDTI